jgi:hypothetical protein
MRLDERIDLIQKFVVDSLRNLSRLVANVRLCLIGRKILVRNTVDVLSILDTGIH